VAFSENAERFVRSTTFVCSQDRLEQIAHVAAERA
jgi:hypothetical protein